MLLHLNWFNEMVLSLTILKKSKKIEELRGFVYRPETGHV